MDPPLAVVSHLSLLGFWIPGLPDIRVLSQLNLLLGHVASIPALG